MKTPERKSVYDQITERITGLLEKGTVPWRKPWKSQGELPCNLVTKKQYRGINLLLLHAASFESPYWLTFRQALESGGSVRRGEKSCPVVFWKQLEIEDEASGEKEKIPMMRFYHVFNVAQCDGLKNVPAPAHSTGTLTPAMTLAKAGAIVSGMPNPPQIKYGMARAFYSPGADFVGLPQFGSFRSEAGYYGTLFHELIHATGHVSRLNRSTVMESAEFGSNPYCKEELIAEMGAAFLCGQAGIAESTVENSVAYIQNWLEQLKNDRTLIVQAAAQAQKAADFILGVKNGEASAEQKQPTTA
jgi:antirestriction protein ArdC